MSGHLKAFGRWVASLVGRDELVLCIGLSLIAVGFWDWWRPGVALVPGALLVWIAMPVRQPFIYQSRRRKES